MRTLFIGNGINLLKTDGNSWSDVLHNLENKFIGIELTKDGVPFPILYEEILLRSENKDKNSNVEDDIRNTIKDQLNKIKRNEIHEKLLQKEFENIITTNYDYGFFNGDSKSANLQYYPDWESNPFFVEIKKIKDRNSDKERDYRFRTYYEKDNTKFWHIHGEINSLSTIVLGHEKYSKVIHNMENYLEKALKNLDPFTFDEIKYGWIDLFFISDIDIVGLSLDFSEIDLWYLLNYRARKIKSNSQKQYNRITYYSFVELENELLKTTEETDFMKSKRRSKQAFKEVLESHYIEFKVIKSESYFRAYNQYLDEF